ncbi:MAG: hypothetical protein RMY34_23445 [Aulosira sp. DedQUE10]|nr:hypothetical protein [Aulosira sp. DedQUE10]
MTSFEFEVNNQTVLNVAILDEKFLRLLAASGGRTKSNNSQAPYLCGWSQSNIGNSKSQIV